MAKGCLFGAFVFCALLVAGAPARADQPPPNCAGGPSTLAGCMHPTDPSNTLNPLDPANSCNAHNGACMTAHTGSPAGYFDRTAKNAQGVSTPCKVYSLDLTRQNLKSYFDSIKSLPLLKTDIFKSTWADYIESQKAQVDQLIVPGSEVKPSSKLGKITHGNDDCAGILLFAQAKDEAQKTLSGLVRLDDQMGDFNLNPAEKPDHKALLVPDKEQPFLAEKLLKNPLTNQAQVGSNPEDKIRKWLAAKLEQQVRVFLGGTQQLKVDYPQAPLGATEIKGYYQGHEPNLSHPGAGQQPVYYSKTPFTQPCGIVNPLNHQSVQIFRAPSGQFEQELVNGPLKKVRNHSPECQGLGGWPTTQTHPKAPTIRGLPVIVGWKLMQEMQKSLLAGKLLPADSYEYVDALPGKGFDYETQIEKHRKSIREKLATLKQGFDEANTDPTAVRLECSDVDLQDPTPGGKTLGAQQSAGCQLSAMQLLVETQLVSEYMFFVWHKVWERYRAMLTEASIQSASREPVHQNDEGLFLLPLAGLSIARRRRKHAMKNISLVLGLGLTGALAMTGCDGTSQANNEYFMNGDDQKTWFVMEGEKFKIQNSYSAQESGNQRACERFCKTLGIGKTAETYNAMAAQVRDSAAYSAADRQKAKETIETNDATVKAAIETCLGSGNFEVNNDAALLTDNPYDPEVVGPAQESVSAACTGELAEYVMPNASTDSLLDTAGQVVADHATTSNTGGISTQLGGEPDQAAAGNTGDGNLASTQNASAGGVSDPGGASKQTGPSGTGGSGFGPGPGRRSGGGGGSGGSAGSTGLLGSNIATPPASGSLTGDAAKQAAAEVGGKYTSGAANGGAGADPYGYAAGRGIASEISATAPDSMDFGATGPSELNAMAPGADPEDYFTRLGLGDSLFKTVERKYREKATGWAVDVKQPRAKL